MPATATATSPRPTEAAATRRALNGSIREVRLVGPPGGAVLGGAGSIILGGRLYRVEADRPAVPGRYWHLQAANLR